MSKTARWVRLLISETGASLVEYALLVALIGVVSIGAITLVGDEVDETLDCGAYALGQPPPTRMEWVVLHDQNGFLRDVQVPVRTDNCA